jgi:predicted HD superfamily hydrolase involved in NAD metabolism
MSSIASQARHIRTQMETRPKGLIQHVQRVLVEALDLAVCWEADPARVELATWGHDLFRAEKPGNLLRMAREIGISIEPADEAEPVLLHGPIAAAVLRDRFKVSDEESIAAVRDHTLGLAEMPLIAKIILIADKVEPNKRRRDPAMKAIRRIARRDLDTALLCWADWKWVQERTHHYTSHPQHWRARQQWVAEHHLDRAMPQRTPDDDAGGVAS